MHVELTLYRRDALAIEVQGRKVGLRAAVNARRELRDHLTIEWKRRVKVPGGEGSAEAELEIAAREIRRLHPVHIEIEPSCKQTRRTQRPGHITEWRALGHET